MTTPRNLRAVPTGQGTATESRWDVIDIKPADDPLPLLPDGEIVDVIVTACEVRSSFDGGWRAVLTCDVLADGAPRTMVTADGEVLPVKLPLFMKLPKRKGRRGPFAPAPRGSKFYRTWVLANGSRKPTRCDRMSLEIFRRRLFRAKTHAVTTDSKNQPLAKELHHSIIAELIP